MLLIGSHALKHHVDLNRIPKDYDIICTHDEFQKWLKPLRLNIEECFPINNGKKVIVKTEENIFEFEIAWDSSTAKELLELHSSLPCTYEKMLGDIIIAPLNTLYVLKMSHRFKKNSPHFLKTMSDIKLMRTKNATMPDDLMNWFLKREKETYDYAHPNLNQSKNNFFDPNQGISYIYDHDSIHESMKHLDKPAYTFFKENDKEVKCNKNLFENLPYTVRLFSVLEETYVLALERSQIPFKNKILPKKSFLIALEKVCTSISSGWWRDFAWENYNTVLELYDENYTIKFWNAVEKGEVKLWNP